MPIIKKHQELEVYKRAFKNAMKIFQTSKSFPSSEKYSLTSQITRSSRSVCANLAEAWRKRKYIAAFRNKLTDSMMEAAETGSAPAPYDQMDLPRFGDGARAAEIIQEIGTGGPLGKLIGQGVVATGAALGVERVPAVKGQAMSAYDPRVIKGTGVTYATSPQGADHTAGLTLFAPIDHRDPDLAVEASRNSQIIRAAYDALGLCVFNLAATVMRSDLVLEMLNTQYGVDLSEDYLTKLGLSVIKEELKFNRGAGLSSKDNRLPAYFTNEQLPPTNDVFNVTDDDLDRIWSDLLDD